MSKLNSNVIENKSQVICGIYKIENLINHKVYIGQSKDIYQRWYIHKRVSFNKNRREHNYPLYRAIRKYGIENFSFEIIKETYDLDYWEVFLIQIYHSLSNEFGYNLREGGNGTFILTEEQKLNWIDLHKKIYHNKSQEEKDRLAKEHSEKMLKRHKLYGKTVKEFNYNKHGKNNPMYGKHRTDKEKQHLSKLHSIKIKCVETEEIFNRCKDANMKYNCEINSKILDKPNRTVHGLHFIRITKVKCIELNKIFESVEDASKQMKIEKGLILKCLCLDTCNDYHWKFIEVY